LIDSRQVVTQLWRLWAEALLSLGQTDKAARLLQEAIMPARQQQAGPALWRLLVSQGRAARQREKAEALFDEARFLIEGLADNISDELLRANFLAQAIAMIPPVIPLSPRQVAKRASGGLTSREREVAAQIAQGQSNRAIAETLVLSERTVEKHVENIMTKLGFAARSQIAAWAVAKGLVKPGQ
jgi:DNA-binding NarL/FixJ family response regulator